MKKVNSYKHFDLFKEEDGTFTAIFPSGSFQFSPELEEELKNGIEIDPEEFREMIKKVQKEFAKNE